MNEIQELTPAEIFHRLSRRNDESSSAYLRFYSTWLGGYTSVPGLMIIPIDDHQVHRGDAVFEAFRFENGKFLDLDAHLDRLERSSRALSITWPSTRKDLSILLNQLVSGLEHESIIVRLYLSRGPGGFSTDPRESVGSQLYIVLTRFRPISKEARDRGAHVGLSKVPLKPPPFHGIKSCNYLPNVLMKMEAIAEGMDFMIGCASDGEISEGPTENILFLTKDRRLVAPSFEVSLKGTTLLRTLELARLNQSELGLTSVEVRPIYIKEMKGIVECSMIGTTLEVWPVSQLFGEQIVESSTMKSLHQYLRQDYGIS